MSATIFAGPTSLQPLADNLAWLILGTCLISLFFYLHLLRSTLGKKLYDVGGLPIFSAWSFFSQRYDFIWDNFHSSGGLPFRFRVLKHRVVAVSGSNARKMFFTNPNLDLSEGYKILMGNAPRVEELDVPPLTENFKDVLIKRLHLVLRRERIAELLPLLLDDLNRCMVNWGRESVIDPFKEINDIVFKMTLRMATCDTICRDPEAVKTITNLYYDLENSTTPVALLFPWFPSPSKIMNRRATSDLYNFILKFVQDRRASGRASTKEPIDVLIQTGDKDADIVGMVMGIVFAAFIDTRIYSRWAVVYLGVHDQWRQRATSEIQAMILAHSDANADAFHKQLASIPLSAWEDELPSLDCIIRETIRLSGSLTFLRRNAGSDIEAKGVHIAKGDFLIYSVTDIHMNENVYPNPERFDPGRYEDGRNEDKSEPFGYVGFGVGRHPCAGTRIAKLEMKIILAMMLLGYDYTVVDEHGQEISELPGPNRNDTFQARPLGKPTYLKIKRMKD